MRIWVVMVNGDLEALCLTEEAAHRVADEFEEDYDEESEVFYMETTD